MHLLDSRRLTGPNLLLDRPGAVLEVSLSAEEAESAVAAWQTQARRILDAVGWTQEVTAARLFPGGASLAVSAPIDGLYAATEVNEWAWAAAETQFDPAVFEQAVERLRAEIAREANPALIALRVAAAARGVSFLFDHRRASVGLGTGSLTWPVDELPNPQEIDWTAVHDIPVLLVTGTNGKTTTVRLLASMITAAGRAVGVTSTDRVEVDGEVVERGDFSGPGGARRLLRDRRVEAAVLETARGGLLRRGLAVSRASAALVTNIAADHLGEFGIYDLLSLAAVKLVIARAVGPEGRVVLNADDPVLVEAAGGITAPITWFSLDAGKGAAVYLEGGALVLIRNGERVEVARVEEVPITFRGAARHNVANALAAISLAAALGLPVKAMAEGLRRVGGTPEDNPGRANLFERDGARILIDYAHNPHGVLALLNIARSLPAERRLMVIGQAGDRDDEAVRDLARAAWTFRPDHVIVKELPEMLRGRKPGEVPAILEDELLRLGAPPESVTRTDSELEAVREALGWARPGDLLVLLVHTQRDEVLRLLS
ncbi:MAG TPA: Mur ligase family protein [Thermoanaerobaculia bacterium]|jgi:UDP-N-acetylmuramyl tripeptide synthase|nr:Mur ligase family protein [Thermoanaerobaculia bacterium]